MTSVLTPTQPVDLRESSVARAAERERARYDLFRKVFELGDDVDAVAMYLTSLLAQTSLGGKQLRYRLRLLDIAAVARGLRRPSQERVLKTFIRGLHHEAALGPDGTRSPIYSEMLRAMVDSIDRERRIQARDIAFLLVANATGLPGEIVRRLTWDQLRTRKDRLTVSIPHRRAGRGPLSGELEVLSGTPPCAVEAVRDLRRQVGPVNGPVFGTCRGCSPSASSLHGVLRLLPQRGDRWNRSMPAASAVELQPLVSALGRPHPIALRDKALLTLGFSACLTTEEAVALSLRNVSKDPRGLVLRVLNRSSDTAIPYASDSRYCPVLAWTAWLAHLELIKMSNPESPAFPWIHGRCVTTERIHRLRLTHIVRDRCHSAGVVGDFTFTSLRIGFIRTAVRAGVRDDQVLRHADLHWLGSVELHRNREQLVSHSVAGRLGL